MRNLNVPYFVDRTRSIVHSFAHLHRVELRRLQIVNLNLAAEDLATCLEADKVQEIDVHAQLRAILRRHLADGRSSRLRLLQSLMMLLVVKAHHFIFIILSLSLFLNSVLAIFNDYPKISRAACIKGLILNCLHSCDLLCFVYSVVSQQSGN